MSDEDVLDLATRYAVPGQNPSVPIRDGDISTVYDPRLPVPVKAGFPFLDPGIPFFKNTGQVVTNVSPDGRTITNTTRPGHVLHDGQAVQWFEKIDGNWYVTTVGSGNNVRPYGAELNESQGPKIFDKVDEQLREAALRKMRGLADARYLLQGGSLAKEPPETTTVDIPPVARPPVADRDRVYPQPSSPFPKPVEDLFRWFTPRGRPPETPRYYHSGPRG